MAGGYNKQQEHVRDYFDGDAFKRWEAISTGNGRNFAQRKLIEGRMAIHQCVLDWVGPVEGKRILDAGCGAGVLAERFVDRGASYIKGIDISEKMIDLAQKQGSGKVEYAVCDLMSEHGNYDILVSMDVLIHYSLADMPTLLEHVLARAKEKAYISFAPSTPLFRLLKAIGKRFSGGSRTTNAYLHRIADIRTILQGLGYQITRQQLFSNVIYNAVLLEIRPVNPKK
ncbi:magnesium protoporphyrin IX methyltransferase [Heliophilum fasciatum]|uniref:Magnesium protoporphyrin IX methyltransferase n=1 Tax=Heliophilum fasciatum TaxID=35700 RepID=A0A4R2RY34_9FIRM|nr:magnesium protoporphyrin IX methyltransferase [Heliophilum fasciatum]MCW2277050.1 magnesium-protoporphyrin O-methyltransferase [Heliophilum fasciatum]TCP68424.1 Mg-protoporphyrin IX methyltransferase [Heliophilum fasciatum]